MRLPNSLGSCLEKLLEFTIKYLKADINPSCDGNLPLYELDPMSNPEVPEGNEQLIPICPISLGKEPNKLFPRSLKVLIWSNPSWLGSEPSRRLEGSERP